MGFPILEVLSDPPGTFSSYLGPTQWPYSEKSYNDLCFLEQHQTIAPHFYRLMPGCYVTEKITCPEPAKRPNVKNTMLNSSTLMLIFLPIAVGPVSQMSKGQNWTPSGTWAFEGQVKGWGARSKFTQAYPLMFCRTLPVSSRISPWRQEAILADLHDGSDTQHELPGVTAWLD